MEQARRDLDEQGIVQVTENPKDKRNNLMISSVLDARWKKC
jgi:hypothetical protein